MSRFTVWSPHDGQPLPVRNARERDALIARGYSGSPPDAGLVGVHGPELDVPEEEGDGEPSETAGADSADLPADSKRGRVRGRQKPVADELGPDTGADGEVPPSAE